MRKRALLFMVGLVVLAATVVSYQTSARTPDDPVVKKIIEIGTSNNQVMTWNDFCQ